MDFFINNNVGKHNNQYNKLYITNEIHQSFQDKINLVSYSKYTSAQFDIITNYTTYSKQEKEKNKDVYNGKVYKTKYDLKLHMSKLALTSRFNQKISNSNKKTKQIKCKDEKCKWKLRANIIGESSVFKVTMYDGEHLHEKTFQDQQGIRDTYKYVVDNIKDVFKDTISDIHSKKGVKIS